MTDSELLDFAAKAAGLTHQQRYKVIDAMERTERIIEWNPLTDDGDALRLAVKLGLTIWNEQESAGSVCCTRSDGEEFPLVLSGEVGDPPGITNADYAATRRAIVLAAAEIGKKSPEAPKRKSA